jgi:hypothetical protein
MSTLIYYTLNCYGLSKPIGFGFSGPIILPYGDEFYNKENKIKA